MKMLDPQKVAQLKDHQIEAMKIFSDYLQRYCKETEIPQDIYAVTFYAMRKSGANVKNFFDMTLATYQFRSQLHLIESLRKFKGGSFGG